MKLKLAMIGLALTAALTMTALGVLKAAEEELKRHGRTA